MDALEYEHKLDENLNLLRVACIVGNTDEVRRLIPLALYKEGKCKDHRVKKMVDSSDGVIINYILDNFEDLKSVGLDKDQVFRELCTTGNIGAVSLMIRRGIDVNSTKTSEYGHSPLHKACSYGMLGIARLLLESGAIVDAKNRILETPLQCACRDDKYLLMVERLIKKGANVNNEDIKGQTPLHLVPMMDRNCSSSLLTIMLT